MDASLWLYLAPLILIQLGLMVFALRDLLLRRPPHWQVWLVVVVCISLIGPILYFTLGRRENDAGRPPDN